jgi:hypothetical protein
MVEVMKLRTDRKGRLQAMANEARRPVVILYEHALLGEGIALYVLAQTGVEAIIAPAHACDAVTAALASDPAVIIFELHSPLPQGDLAILAPRAVLIDVSTAVTRGSCFHTGAAGLEHIGQAVRGLSATA